MLLATHLPAEEGWDLRILATDISNRVLAKAREGIYPIAKSTELPIDLLHRFMLRGIAERQGEMKVKIEIQQMVEFRRVNLNQESDLGEGPFDAIFCRNVLIYFDLDSKRRVVERLVRHLAADGVLFVGHAENLNSVSSSYEALSPPSTQRPGTKTICKTGRWILGPDREVQRVCHTRMERTCGFSSWTTPRWFAR